MEMIGKQKQGNLFQPGDRAHVIVFNQQGVPSFHSIGEIRTHEVIYSARLLGKLSEMAIEDMLSNKMVNTQDDSPDDAI